MLTRAAILVEQQKPLVVADIELPDELAAGQVRVRVHHSGVCGSQLGEIAGVKGPDKWLPHLLGHEGGAVVEAVGPGVRHVTAGDHVVMHWRKGAGIDAAPATYRWGGKTVNSGCITTFNRHAVVSENRLTKIPGSTPLDLAALFGCPVPTGMGVVENNARLKPGQSIVVWGAGGVGLSIIQAAALTSAHPIIAIDLHDARLDLAEQLGATHRVNAADQSPAETAAAVAALLPAPPDVVVDNTGRPDLIRCCYDLTSSTGRTILVGVPRAGADTTLHTLPLHFEKRLLGSHGGEANPVRDIPRYLRLLDAGLLKLKPLITKRYPLDGINDALDDLRTGALAGRAIIDL